jgi:hypothetical protein
MRVLPLLMGVCAAAGTASGLAAQDEGRLRLEAGEVGVEYHAGDARLAERVLEVAVAPQRFPGLPEDFRLERGTVYLVRSAEEWERLTGGRAPAWGAGVAIPARREILLPVFSRGFRDSDPATVLRHELAHLALAEYLPAPIPRWFDEGYATWASGGFDQAAAWQLRLALFLGRAPPLDSLRLSWPREAGEARLAYLLSASAVHHLATRAPPGAFEGFLRAWRRTGTFDAALRASHGMTSGQLESEWRQAVRRRYGWLLAISQVGVFWFFAAILVIVLRGIRRKRDRERLEALEATIAREDAAAEEASRAEAERLAAEEERRRFGIRWEDPPVDPDQRSE